jgi:short-subunit dehydrogenase
VTISESLYFELAMSGAPVSVSVLCPGFVRTNIMASERNRPAELQTTPQPTSEAQQALRAAFESSVAAGIPPSEVAARVLESIREERFYVFPHPDMLGAVRDRMEAILAQRNPAQGMP